MITVHYFAGIRELTGTATEELSLSGKTVGQLKEELIKKYPSLQESSIQFAVNEEYALPAELLVAGDVVALIPPVSGG